LGFALSCLLRQTQSFIENLLHEQVAVAWTNYLRADCILIANDEVAENEFRKSTLRLAKPAGCKIVFKSIYCLNH